jgi:hypothetical protein
LAYPTYLKAPFLTSGTSKKIQFGLIAPGGAAILLLYVNQANHLLLYESKTKNVLNEE